MASFESYLASCNKDIRWRAVECDKKFWDALLPRIKNTVRGNINFEERPEKHDRVHVDMFISSKEYAQITSLIDQLLSLQRAEAEG